MAVVDKDEHKNRELVVSRFPMRIYEIYLSFIGVFRLSGSETAFSISLRTSALSPSPLAFFSKARIISLESSDSL